MGIGVILVNPCHLRKISLVITSHDWVMGGNQLGFSDYELAISKNQAKRGKLLSEMEVVVPWQVLSVLIDSCYPNPSNKGGRIPIRLATMQQIYL